MKVVAILSAKDFKVLKETGSKVRNLSVYFHHSRMPQGVKRLYISLDGKKVKGYFEIERQHRDGTLQFWSESWKDETCYVEDFSIVLRPKEEKKPRRTCRRKKKRNKK